MTSEEAEDFIAYYWRSIKDLRPRAIVQSKGTLRFTSGKIKCAHFVFREAMAKTMVEDGSHLVFAESYGLIDSLFVEDPDSVNAAYREYVNGLEHGVITDFLMPNPFGECAQVLEYYDFLGECLLHNHNKKMPDEMLDAFVYEAVRKKAAEANDVETLIELAGSPLTRNVMTDHLP